MTVFIPVWLLWTLGIVIPLAFVIFAAAAIAFCNFLSMQSFRPW